MNIYDYAQSYTSKQRKKRLKDKELPFHSKRIFRLCFIIFPLVSVGIVVVAMLLAVIYYYLVIGG